MLHPAVKLADPRDTIVALATPVGSGRKAIVRLSGPDALHVLSSLFSSADQLERKRQFLEGHLQLPELHSPIPVQLYVWPAPHSYTGQDLLELHLISSPPLLDLVVACLLGNGARAAQAGEFTARAFLAGKLDLTRAEAVLGIIEATSRDDLTQSLAQYAGGVSGPLHGLRSELLDLLAEVEAGLDFAEEDLHFVGREELLHKVSKAMALLTIVQRQLQQRAVAGRPFRVVLTGKPNAGKSSLFNALGGANAALVSPEPGTTRDYLVQRLDLDGAILELVDTAGLRETSQATEADAQQLGRGQIANSDLALVCIEAGTTPNAGDRDLLKGTTPPAIVVATKCDLAEPASGEFATSAVTGAGVDRLRAALTERVRTRKQPALAPSLSRCRNHVDACLNHLRLAHSVVLFEEPSELLALELRGALDQLGEMVGAVYSDDLLDRIFSRFCIGK